LRGHKKTKNMNFKLENLYENDKIEMKKDKIIKLKELKI